MSQYELALKIAEEAHQGQQRRGGEPYINHPMRVAAAFDDDLTKAVAMLHDVIEDTERSEASLSESGVSDEVIESVRRLTKSSSLPYEDYLNEVKANPRALRVKIADMIDNLTDNPTDKQVAKYRRGLMILAGVAVD